VNASSGTALIVKNQSASSSVSPSCHVVINVSSLPFSRSSWTRTSSKMSFHELSHNRDPRHIRRRHPVGSQLVRRGRSYSTTGPSRRKRERVQNATTVDAAGRASPRSMARRASSTSAQKWSRTAQVQDGASHRWGC
jgi:hypothetical protein